MYEPPNMTHPCMRGVLLHVHRALCGKFRPVSWWRKCLMHRIDESLDPSRLCEYDVIADGSNMGQYRSDQIVLQKSCEFLFNILYNGHEHAYFNSSCNYNCRLNGRRLQATGWTCTCRRPPHSLKLVFIARPSAPPFFFPSNTLVSELPRTRMWVGSALASINCKHAHPIADRHGPYGSVTVHTGCMHLT